MANAAPANVVPSVSMASYDRDFALACVDLDYETYDPRGEGALELGEIDVLKLMRWRESLDACCGSVLG
jgi:hypothetical protein